MKLHQRRRIDAGPIAFVECDGRSKARIQSLGGTVVKINVCGNCAAKPPRGFREGKFLCGKGGLYACQDEGAQKNTFDIQVAKETR